MLLSIAGIQKSFGNTPVLRDCNLEVAAGEVHLLMGENGAGKSTLMKIAAGLQRADRGQMRWRGKLISFNSPADAARLGIAMVHQESLLAPHLSVAENIFLGREPAAPLGWLSQRRLRAQARRLITEHGFPLHADALVSTLSPAGKQLVEICRALASGSSLLIFDEPTSSLSDAETKEVFRVVRKLRDHKIGIIYITHRLEELRSIGDRVTILRDGATVHSSRLSDLTRDDLIRHMVGRTVDHRNGRSTRSVQQQLLKVTGLSTAAIQNVSFELKAGEIVGLAGLMGAGRTELCRALFGLDPIASGVIEVAGEPLHPRRPQTAIDAGLALIPEDRQQHGLVLRLSAARNICLPNINAVSPVGFLRRRAESALAERYRARLQIRCRSVQQPAATLSGGNQQKVVIAKWIARGARVFLFDEPTRGIDIGAKQEVFHQIDQLARSGAAVLLVSSEIPELLHMCDRILVMAQGRLAGELDCPASAEAIMRLAAPVLSRSMAASA